jgi:hypothetical protein
MPIRQDRPFKSPRQAKPKDDSEDVEKVEPVYVVEYMDGDREDMGADELQYAHEFYLERLGVDVGNESDASGSNDEESYRPSPKVFPNHQLRPSPAHLHPPPFTSYQLHSQLIVCHAVYRN